PGSEGSTDGRAWPSWAAAASAGTWRHKLPVARMAPGGSRTALRLTLLYPLAPCGPLAWLPSRCRGLLNPPNRRIRTRTSGGVGGEESRDSPLFRFVANCCYRASRSSPRCCVALGKNTLEALTRNPPRGGRAKPIAPAARAAPQHHHLARDAEHLGHLPDSEVVELTWFHSARSTLWTRARIRLPAFAENDGIGRLREDTNSLKLKRGCLVQT